MTDGGDGSVSTKLVATEQEALAYIGFSSKEEMEENYACFYDNGGYRQVTIEIEVGDDLNGILTKGFSINTDDCEMS